MPTVQFTQFFRAPSPFLDRLKPRLPETLRPDIHAEILQQDLRRPRPARRQEREIPWDERLAVSPIERVERQHQEVAEAVCVAVERAREKVGDRQPFPPEFIRYRDRSPELLAKLGQVYLAEVLH